MEADNSEMTLEEKCIAVADLCRQLGITSDMLGRVSDILEDDGRPKKLESNDISNLRLPSFDSLQRLIGISEESYNRVKDIWEKLGQYNYRNFEPKYGNHTSEFYQMYGTFENGISWLYIGQIVPNSDSKQGKGIRIYNHGQFEEGYWLDDKQHGKGRCIFKHGGLYEGEWKLNRKHGYGEYTFKDGDKYVGHYCNEKRDGEGVLIRADGTIERGLWEQGDLIYEY